MKGKIEGTVDKSSSVEGDVVIEKGAVIQASIIKGPSIIGKNTKIIDSYVGPYTSIYHNVTVSKSKLEYSIILENCRIEGMKYMKESLLGQGVEIVKSGAEPAAYRIMVGDMSRIELI